MEISLILVNKDAAKEIKALYTHDKDYIAQFINDDSVVSPNYTIILFGAVIFIVILLAIFFTLRKK